MLCSVTPFTNLIFASKAGKPHYMCIHIRWYLWVGSSLAHKYNTRLTDIVSDKYSSFLRYGINYGRKKFCGQNTKLPLPQINVPRDFLGVNKQNEKCRVQFRETTPTVHICQWPYWYFEVAIWAEHYNLTKEKLVGPVCCFRWMKKKRNFINGFNNVSFFDEKA